MPLKLKVNTKAGILDLIDLVADAYCIRSEQLVSSDRHKEIVRARWSAAYILRTKYKLSLDRIGKYLHRDHSTIQYALIHIEKDKKLMVLESRVK